MLNHTTCESVTRFMRGEINWAKVTGMSMEQAYSIAELGYNLFNQGKIDPAEKIFEGLVDVNPSDPYFHGMLGSIWARQGKLELALESFTRGACLEPKDPQIFVSRAEIFLQMGRFEEALSDLRRAIAIEPEGNNPAIIRARTMAGATARMIQEIVQKK